jgi:molecular chaperone GrpE (heat shock protein)
MSCPALLQTIKSVGSSTSSGISGFFHGMLNRSSARSEEDYRTQAEKAQEKAVQLNRLLFPLMAELKEAALSLSTEEVVQRLEQLKAQSHLEDGEFDNLRKQRENDSEAEIFKKFRNNGRQAYRFGITDHSQAIRLENFKYTEPNSERINEMGEFHSTLSAGLTPVGYYGEKFAADILRTTQIMAQLVDDYLSAKSVSLYQANKDFFDNNMHRAIQIAHGKENGQPELSLNSAMMEGILTFSQLVGVLLNGGVEGIEDPQKALLAIVEGGANKRGLTATVTQLIAPGIVAPMTHAGFAFSNTLRLNSDNQWVLTEEMRNTLKFFKETYSSRRNRAAIGCPFAFLDEPEPDPFRAKFKRRVFFSVYSESSPTLKSQSQVT